MTLEDLKKAIKASDLSYQQIANKAGITKQTVYMIASGRCARPMFQTVESIIEALK